MFFKFISIFMICFFITSCYSGHRPNDISSNCYSVGNAGSSRLGSCVYRCEVENDVCYISRIGGMHCGYNVNNKQKK